MAATAAESMRLTSERLLKLKLIDGIVPEPTGGAHWDAPATFAAAGSALQRSLEEVSDLSVDDLLAARHRKYLAIGSGV